MLEQLLEDSEAIIYEMNFLVRNQTDDQKREALQSYTEMDYLYRFAVRNRPMDVKFSKQGLRLKNAEITVRHWRSWDEVAGVPRPKNWKEGFGTSFDWASDSSDRYFIGVWSPVNEWRYVLMFGDTTGKNPFVSKEKSQYFPFVDGRDGRISGLKTLYDSNKYGLPNGMKCYLIGNEKDAVNIVIYSND